jgi:hypothetical protein
MVGSIKEKNKDPSWCRQKVRPYLQINESRKGWGGGSSGGVSA